MNDDKAQSTTSRRDFIAGGAALAMAAPLLAG
ncbi:twin-arginine translocation signal domain-containing protein, partial [bacterium]|nr:twin-arginine translocation signal domain-containing protein [bacterium]